MNDQDKTVKLPITEGLTTHKDKFGCVNRITRELVNTNKIRFCGRKTIIPVDNTKHKAHKIHLTRSQIESVYCEVLGLQVIAT